MGRLKLSTIFHSEGRTIAYITDDNDDCQETVAIGQRWRSSAGNVYRVDGFDAAQQRVLVMRVLPVRDWETTPYAFCPATFVKSDLKKETTV